MAALVAAADRMASIAAIAGNAHVFSSLSPDAAAAAVLLAAWRVLGVRRSRHDSVLRLWARMLPSQPAARFLRRLADNLLQHVVPWEALCKGEDTDGEADDDGDGDGVGDGVGDNGGDRDGE